ncbi:MAG: hypothetical protein HC902_08135 [Calothrix sp. SM1_5_4]|nr:hypothetical protein [Calothrix sp. SM1_5_4]
MAADLRGFAALDAKRAEEKALREYIRWLEGTSAIMQGFFNAQPMTKKDLKAMGGRATSVEKIMSIDDGQAEALESSGEGLVLMDFMNRRRVLELMRYSGIDVGTGSNREERVFWT